MLLGTYAMDEAAWDNKARFLPIVQLSPRERNLYQRTGATPLLSSLCVCHLEMKSELSIIYIQIFGIQKTNQGYGITPQDQSQVSISVELLETLRADFLSILYKDTPMKVRDFRDDRQTWIDTHVTKQISKQFDKYSIEISTGIQLQQIAKIHRHNPIYRVLNSQYK